MTALIEADNLTKSFGPFTAVDGISLRVEPGEVLGFLGPNGAGKTTTMKMLTGFLVPSAGRARVAGHDVVKDPIAAKTALGYLPEGAPAWGDMTARAFLRFIADVRGLEDADAAIARAAAAVHIDTVMNQPIETLSKGFRRRVGLAQAILHDPQVLILDEPTDGLDPNQKHEVRRLIRDMSRDKAIIISTHILEEVDAVCTRAVIIREGRIVADGTPRDLRARSRFEGAVRLVFGTRPQGAATSLAALAGVAAAENKAEDEVIVFPGDGADILAPVRDHAASSGWDITQIVRLEGRMDDVFRTLTSGEAA